MSKKENPEENPAPMPEFEIEAELFEQEPQGMLKLTYLVNLILDYYQEDEVPEGEDWKKATGQMKRAIPEDLDAEVKRTFIAQLKNFQE